MSAQREANIAAASAGLPWPLLVMVAGPVLKAVTKLLVHKTPEEIGAAIGREAAKHIGDDVREALGGVVRQVAEEIVTGGAARGGHQ